MKIFICAVVSCLIFALQTYAGELKILIPSNASGDFSGVGIAFGVTNPVTQGVCETQVCKYQVPAATTVSLWMAKNSPQYEFEYWIKNKQHDTSVLLKFQMTEDVTVLAKEKLVATGIPVIIVPGIFGSWSTEMFCNDTDAVRDVETNLIISQGMHPTYGTVIPPQWTVDPIAKTYDFLYAYLAQEGMRPTLFGYDWRQSISYNAAGNPNQPTKPSLIKIIDQVKSQYNVTQVDIVAHSMGGLVVRDYIQNHYRGDIRKFVMIGTPNQGSLDVYKIWEAGNFSSIEGNLDIWVKEIILENMKEGCENSFMKDARFVRQWIPSVKQLLPTFDYFAYPGELEGEYIMAEVEGMCYYNDYLGNLNANANNLVNSGVDVHIFASENRRTLAGFQSTDLHNSEHCSRVNWADERPTANIFAESGIKSAGDGRVLFEKSAYPVVDIPIFEMIPVTVVDGQHAILPSKIDILKGIVDFLRNANGGGPAPN